MLELGAFFDGWFACYLRFGARDARTRVKRLAEVHSDVYTLQPFSLGFGEGCLRID